MTTNDPRDPRDHKPETVSLAKAGGSVASLLRSLAGTPAGWQSSRRRGSFLIIVVGTLALLAVLAIIYSSIGSHDVRMTAAVKKQERLEDIPDQIKDYIATLIGEGTVGTYYDSKRYVTGRNLIPLSRVTFDYPSTNYAAVSNITAPSATQMPFTPTGSVSGFMGTFNYTDQSIAANAAASLPRVWAPSTPWLADAQPTYLGPALDFATAERMHQLRRDLRKISNIAPDGRFVNLYNMRPNRYGWSATHVQMSEETNRIYSGTEPGTGPAALPGPTVRNADFDNSVALRIDTPAHLDSRQIWLFRPARPSAGLLPSNPAYDLNLFADADGDGMFDSRWQELKDGRLGDKNYLDVDDRYRIFVAVKIIDASAMININTATDQRGAPEGIAPVGLTPADIDLRKLLSGWDARISSTAGNIISAMEVSGVGYESLNQDFPLPGPATDATRDPYNYETATLADGRNVSFSSGIYAYDALRLSILTGSTPPIGLTGPALGTTYEATYGAQHDRWNFDNQPLYKSDHYNWMSVGLQGASRDLAAATPTVRMTGSFNVDDLYELNIRRVTNDAAVTSNLELTLGGRAEVSTARYPDETRYSPLRSNRPLEIERRRYSLFDSAAGSDYDKTMLLFETDLRQHVTPISGARQLRLAPAYIDLLGNRSVDPYELSTNELRTDIRLNMAILADPATTAAVTAAKAAATNQIFRGYVDALLPRLAFGTPWAANNQGTERQTEFYGHRGPELALRVAAHMAVNFIDCFDKGVPATSGGPVPPEQPSVHTLLVHRDAAAGLNGLANNTAEGVAVSNWKEGARFQVTPSGGSPVDIRPLELPGPTALANERLASGTEVVTAPVINVYGVEAQPFITQVATFTVYGDDTGNSDGETSTHNIKGGTDRATNSDLMYRMVAFQIHNPFDVDIKLSNQTDTNVNQGTINASNTDNSFYYLTFGAKTFKLGKLSEEVDAQGVYASDSVRIEPLTIPAGRTIVVYALTDTPQEILKRMSGLGGMGTGGEYLHQNDGTGSPRYKVQRYIERALHANLGAFGTGNPRVAGVYWIPEVSTAGLLETPTAENELIPDAPPAGRPDVFANLWRTIRVDHPDFDPPNTDNLTGNDQLVDRLRIPNDGTHYAEFNRALPVGQNDITGSDPTSNLTLYTVTCVGVVSRPGDPAAGSPPRGSVPAYCIEPKFDPTWNTVDAGDFGVGGAALTHNAFIPRNAPRFEGAARDLNSWFTHMSDSEISNIAKHPDDLPAPTTPTPMTGGVGADGVTRPYVQNRIEVPVLDNNLRTRGSGATPPTVTTVRPADLLLPIGVGPEEMPLDTSFALITDLERRWTTLGEALAMSLLYQTNRSPSMDDVGDLYFPVTGSMIDPVFTDRAGLRLDAFAPYIDVNRNQVFDAGDERVGTQAPLALSVLDTFTTSPADFESNYRWDTLARATPGVINVNTAALNVLRAGFPTLTPPPNTDFNGNPWWWWAAGELNSRSDIAATVVAYRDKVDQYVNALAQVANPRSIAPPNGQDPSQDRLVTFAYDVANGGTPADPDNDVGRSIGSQVVGIHEQAGFRTRGELLAANFIYDTSDPATIAQSRGWPGNMAFLGHDINVMTNQPTPSNIEGLDTLLYRDSAGAIVASEIPNSYKEQLSVINSVLNSVSTRSDYFICWFLVHGYQKSDVENLGDNDPMVPSMARRFIMIVDRSKVTRLGEKPEVILFKEVPVDPMPR